MIQMAKSAENTFITMESSIGVAGRIKVKNKLRINGNLPRLFSVMDKSDSANIPRPD